VTETTVVVTKTVYFDTTTTLSTTIISNKTTTVTTPVVASPVVVLPPVDNYVLANKGVNVLNGARAYSSSFLNSVSGVVAVPALMLD
jgi:hypothetical protein